MGSKWFRSVFSAFVFIAVLWSANVLLCSPSVVEKEVTANALAGAYWNDPDVAQDIYGGAIVQVEGIVQEVVGEPLPTAVILQADDSTGYQGMLIECRLQERARRPSRAVAAGFGAVFAGRVATDQPVGKVVLNSCLLVEHY
jgi:hypothetical protein